MKGMSRFEAVDGVEVDKGRRQTLGEKEDAVEEKEKEEGLGEKKECHRI